MSQAFTDLLINNLFAVCDLDHNDQLSLIEILGATVTASLSMRSSTLFGGGEKDICSVSDCVNALEKAFADTVFVRALLPVDWVMLCYGYLSMPMCHGFHNKDSYRVVHWRGSSVGLLLSFPTTSLAYNITNILISTITT
jgi:hypothetical protein